MADRDLAARVLRAGFRLAEAPGAPNPRSRVGAPAAGRGAGTAGGCPAPVGGVAGRRPPVGQALARGPCEPDRCPGPPGAPGQRRARPRGGGPRHRAPGQDRCGPGTRPVPAHATVLAPAGRRGVAGPGARRGRSGPPLGQDVARPCGPERRRCRGAGGASAPRHPDARFPDPGTLDGSRNRRRRCRRSAGVTGAPARWS